MPQQVAAGITKRVALDGGRQAMSTLKPRTLQQLLAASPPYAREDRWRSWAAVLSTAALTLGALALAASPIPLLLRVTASLLASLLRVRCFVTDHDFEHAA